MSQRRKKRAVLTNLELEVMRIVWEAAPTPLTVRQVVERLNAGRSRVLAYNTVQTMLTILRDKGIVRSRPGEGRAHEYSARLTQEEVTTSMVGDLVERLFDGNAKPLLLNLMENEDLSREDLEGLERLIRGRLADGEEVTP